MGMFSSPKPFSKKVIKKTPSKLFKEGVKEKEALAERVGKRGFSELEFEEKLKEDGYKPKRRENIMDGILGKKEEKKGLTIDDFKHIGIDEFKEKYRNKVGSTLFKKVLKEKMLKQRLRIAQSNVGSERADERQKITGTSYNPTQRRAKESGDKIISRIKAGVTKDRLGSVLQPKNVGYATDSLKKKSGNMPASPTQSRGISSVSTLGLKK